MVTCQYNRRYAIGIRIRVYKPPSEGLLRAIRHQEFTRALPYRNSALCHEEQNNWMLVRQQNGYVRYEGAIECHQQQLMEYDILSKTDPKDLKELYEGLNPREIRNQFKEGLLKLQKTSIVRISREAIRMCESLAALDKFGDSQFASMRNASARHGVLT